MSIQYTLNHKIAQDLNGYKNEQMWYYELNFFNNNQIEETSCAAEFSYIFMTLFNR